MLAEALDFTYKVDGRLMRGDAARCYSHVSMLTGSLLTRKCLPHSSLDLKKALSGMCFQKAVVAWDNALSNRIKASLLQRGSMEMDQWLKDVRATMNMCPLQKTAHVMTNEFATRFLCGQSAGDYKCAIFGRKLNLTGP